MTDQAKTTPDDETEEQIWAEIAAAEEGKGGDKDTGKDDADHKFAETPESDNDKPAEGAAPAQEAAPKQEAPDIWDNAPPDLKAAHDAQVRALETATSEHARRSIEGRITAYTRRLKERNEAVAQQPAPAAEEAADPLAELAAEYPEIATPLQQKLAPIAEKLSQFDAQLKTG